jgi:hypothetical protein
LLGQAKSGKSPQNVLKMIVPQTGRFVPKLGDFSQDALNLGKIVPPNWEIKIFPYREIKFFKNILQAHRTLLGQAKSGKSPQNVLKMIVPQTGRFVPKFTLNQGTFDENWEISLKMP